MLFDTSSPGRKRVLRVVYSLLAVLFLVGFVGFGVGGTNSGGGILDALGITDSGGGSIEDQYQQPIDSANKKLEKDPTNERALLSLTRYHYLSASQQANTSGSNEITDAVKNELEDSVAAWSKYLKTKPAQPDKVVASFAANSYQALGDASGAATAQEVVADGTPSAQAYYQLALFQYADSNFKGGDAAAKKAVAEAKGAKERKQVGKATDQLRKRAQQQEKLAKAQQKAGGDQSGAGLDDPFGPRQGAGTTGAGGALGTTP
ncbi:hypothetical protein BH10ACT11_BH10ACT11_18360 [soil metagenome]